MVRRSFCQKGMSECLAGFARRGRAKRPESSTWGAERGARAIERASFWSILTQAARAERQPIRIERAPMPEPNTAIRRAHQRRLMLLISLGTALVLLLAACPLSLVAVQQRLIRPPQFAFTIGGVDFSAPCPTRGLICDDGTPWYAVWRGDVEPDGSITYRQLFFMYLRPYRRR